MIAPTAVDLEQIVFGDHCVWCAREEPCTCHAVDPAADCQCSCGRCQFDGPLPDDGPVA